MGQVRHGSATTTHAVRAAIQRSQASLATLSRELGINPKTVAKWRKRATVEDLKTGPKAPHSTTLTEAEEAAIVAFRRHTLLPLDDCLYALQPSIPHLTRSALHRCLQRHGISRLPDVEGDKPRRQSFKRYPIGFFHMDIAEVQTAEGKLYMFVGIDLIRRWLGLRCAPPASTVTALGRIRSELRRIGVNINQLARAANEFARPTERTLRDRGLLTADELAQGVAQLPEHIQEIVGLIADVDVHMGREHRYWAIRTSDTQEVDVHPAAKALSTDEQI